MCIVVLSKYFYLPKLPTEIEVFKYIIKVYYCNKLLALLLRYCYMHEEAFATIRHYILCIEKYDSNVPI